VRLESLQQTTLAHSPIEIKKQFPTRTATAILEEIWIRCEIGSARWLKDYATIIFTWGRCWDQSGMAAGVPKPQAVFGPSKMDGGLLRVVKLPDDSAGLRHGSRESEAWKAALASMNSMPGVCMPISLNSPNGWGFRVRN
jgi:hypothetical protein